MISLGKLISWTLKISFLSDGLVTKIWHFSNRKFKKEAGSNFTGRAKMATAASTTPTRTTRRTTSAMEGTPTTSATASPSIGTWAERWGRESWKVCDLNFLPSGLCSGIRTPDWMAPLSRELESVIAQRNILTARTKKKVGTTCIQRVRDGWHKIAPVAI